MAVTFLNLFEVPAERDDAFFAQWQEVHSYMRTKPGFISHKLHRALASDANYRYANVAIWASPADWKAAHDEGFRTLVTQPKWKEFPSLPTLYEVVHQSES